MITVILSKVESKSQRVNELIGGGTDTLRFNGETLTAINNVLALDGKTIAGIVEHGRVFMTSTGQHFNKLTVL